MKVKLTYYCLLVFCKLLSLFSLPMLYVLSDFIYFILYRVVKYRNKVVRGNLASSFPEKSEAEILEIEKGFYHQLCDNIVESIKLLTISDRQIMKRVHVTNPEMIQALGEQGKSIFVYLAHMANWEYVPAITMYYSSVDVSGEIYKPLHDKPFDLLMKRIRSRFNTVQIPRALALRQILTLNRDCKSFLVGVIADHRSNSRELEYSTRFLNHETFYEVGAEKIGQKIGVEYIYLEIIKTSRGHYRLTFKPIVPQDMSQPFPYTREYYHLLEQNILQQPFTWLWSHRRWRNRQ